MNLEKDINARNRQKNIDEKKKELTKNLLKTL